MEVWLQRWGNDGMSTFRRDDLLDCLRKLEQERRRCWQEAAKHNLGSTVTHGYLGVADGIDFALGEIMARFGIEAEEIEGEPVRLAPEPSAEAKPEKRMAPSKGKATEERKKKSS
jgi:hypothetical protein